ncbi:MAG TPA: GNAT family N-acetyltransferase [Gaiellaceae bacterium]|nr:GNAT family N-acetyltransferase [Gaiellaceae bacterium]
MNVVVRPARSGDGSGLARAAVDLAEQYVRLDPDRFKIPPEPDQAARTESELRERLGAGRLWLVAEVDGEAVGEVQAFIEEPLDDAALQPQRDVELRRIYVNYIAVQAAFRGRGVGRRLMNEVEQWARDNDVALIVTDTNLRCDDAVRFYEQQGFTRQSVILRKRLV